MKEQYIKTEHSNLYVPKETSPEANICLKCDTNEDCKGNCKRYKEEYKKLKEKESERV